MTNELNKEEINDLKFYFLRNGLFEIANSQEVFERNEEICDKLLADRYNPQLISQVRGAEELETLNDIKKYINDIRRSFLKRFADSENVKEIEKIVMDFNLTRNGMNILLVNHLVFKTFRERGLI